VTGSPDGCVGGTGRCPCIGAGIVPPPGVQTVRAASISAPDDHLAAGPDCSVLVSGRGRVGRAGWSPRVVDAASRRTRYCGDQA
jgi:hypothetical protein